jgi:predicted amidohydrolase
VFSLRNRWGIRKIRSSYDPTKTFLFGLLFSEGKVISKFSIAIAQSASVKGDIEANVAHHLKFVRLAASRGVQIIFFPELSLSGYEPELARECVLSADDERLIPLREICRQSGMTVVAGAPALSASGALHIGSFCLFPDGSTQIYAKQYLHPGEEAFFSPGDRGCSLALADEKIALAICADTTHPEHAREAAKTGATLYAASVLITNNGFHEDTQLLQNYASIYKMAVLMANHSHKTGGFEPTGKSALWDETGQRLIQLRGTEEALIVAEKEAGSWICEIEYLYSS